MKLFFDPPKNKNPSVQKVSLYIQDLWRSKNAFLEVFGVPCGCKSVLNVKILYKSYIVKLFEPRVFLFFGGSKKKFYSKFLAIFVPTLNIFLIYTLRTSIKIEEWKAFLASASLYLTVIRAGCMYFWSLATRSPGQKLKKFQMLQSSQRVSYQ